VGLNDRRPAAQDAQTKRHVDRTAAHDHNRPKNYWRISRGSVVWLQKDVERIVQVLCVVRDDAPDQPVVDGGIAVDEHIPESDHSRQIADGGRRRRIDPPQLGERFARDLELSLNRAAKQEVGLVIGDGLSSSEVERSADGLTRVPDKLPRVIVHRDCAVRPAPAGGSRGCPGRTQ